MSVVLFIVDTLETGGAERSIFEITKRLKRNTPVICVLFAGRNELLSLFEEAGIRVVQLGLKKYSAFWWVKGRRKLSAVIDEIKPDILHAHLVKSELLTRITRIPPQVPLLGAFVNDAYAEHRYRQQSFIQNLKLNFYRVLDAWTARRVYHFTSITHSVVDTNCAALNIPKEKVTVIYRGRDTSGFVVEHPPLEPTQGDVFIFQVVARLLKRKGYLELIRAVSILKKMGINGFVCKVAGDGPDAAIIKKLAEDSDVENLIEFMGNRNDVPVLLAKCHAFVFPSHYEGQGGALIEAMLAGKPIIASDIEVFKEQIEDSVTGVLFAVLDAEDLAQKMIWMMQHYQQGTAMGIKARQVAKHKFDIESVAVQYDNLYDTILTQFRKN